MGGWRQGKVRSVSRTCYSNRFWIRCVRTRTKRRGGSGAHGHTDSKRGPLLRLEYDEEQRGLREAFIDNGGGDGVGDDDDNEVWMVKKGKGYSS